MAHSFRTGPEQQGINLCPRQPVLLPRPRRLAWQIVDGLTQSDALALYRQIVGAGPHLRAIRAWPFFASASGTFSRARASQMPNGTSGLRLDQPGSGRCLSRSGSSLTVSQVGALATRTTRQAPGDVAGQLNADGCD